MMKPLARDWENLAAEFLQPVLHLPRHPSRSADFGIRAMCPRHLLTRMSFKKEAARALFAGNRRPFLSPVGIAGLIRVCSCFGATGNAVRLANPRGGS